MPMIKEKVKKTCDLLKTFSTIPLSKIQDLQYIESDYKTGNTLPDQSHDWLPLGILCGAHKHFWIKGTFKTPPARQGQSYILRFKTGVKGRDMLNPQGILYLNGKMCQGIDTNHMEAFLEPDTAYELYLYLYTSYATIPFQLEIDVAILDEATEGLYYDILTPLEALEFLNPNTLEYTQILSTLEQTVNLTDLRNPHSEAYDQSIQTAAEFINKEFYETLCKPTDKPTVHCIGHTHIDMEWRWDRKQTREKIQRSFATVSALMERYPEYLFTLSQPEIYTYLKEEAPEKYHELTELVRQGRFEPEGSMFVECDCNLSDGESLVRQILYGKRFFRDEFGKDSKVLFLPDVFGYSAALPQILKKSGIDYFVTSKISWNETNTMPFDTFMWQGIDGTEIFSTFITSQKAYPNHVPTRRTVYSAELNASSVMGTYDRYSPKELNGHTLMTYGFGDGGGGPTREMLEKQRRLSKGIPGLPVTKPDFLLRFLQEAESDFMSSGQKLHRLPRWVGELYLEYHRGTYTTMAKNKRGNRKSELLLRKTEALAYTNMLLGGEYDSDGINLAYRKLLHDQFHDILPGTSVKEVYDFTEQDYKEIAAYGNARTANILQKIASSVGSENGTLVVYNPLGFERSGTIVADGKLLELQDSIPSFGWKVIDPSKINKKTLVKQDHLSLENELYALKLDESGNLISIYDKKANREILPCGKKGNVFTAYEDHPYTIYEAWDIGDYYRSKSYEIDTPAVITPFTDGTSAGFKIQKEYMGSTITQKIVLYSYSRRIDFETEIDWHAPHQLLKVAFPLDINATSAAYEIQYGHVNRPTHSNTSWDSARFEVCAHKWVDISEHGYGVSLLNDCKYGYGVNGSTLELTVLKRPTYPYADADEGNHTFTYSLIPHTKDFKEADIIKEAYMLNVPLEHMEVQSTCASLPETFSLVRCDCDNVIIETVKKAEDDDGMIVRLYEAFNGKCTAELSVCDGFKEAYICDLLENELEKLKFDGNKVTFPVSNFEIVTLKFK